MRLAFADASNFTRLAATWSTLDDTATHTVQWAAGANATVFPFSAGGISRTYAPASRPTPAPSATSSNLPPTNFHPLLVNPRCSYTKGGWLGHVHTAIMQLQPGTTYTYRVGDASGGWSDGFTYAALPADVGSEGRPLRLLQVADMAYDAASDHTVRAPSHPKHSR